MSAQWLSTPFLTCLSKSAGFLPFNMEPPPSHGLDVICAYSLLAIFLPSSAHRDGALRPRRPCFPALLPPSPCRKIAACLCPIPFSDSLPPIFLLDRAHPPPPLRLDLASKMLSLTRFSLMGSKKVETKIRDVAARESTSIYPPAPPK